MGTTPTFALPYPEPTDPADVPTDIRELAERVDLLLKPALVTNLPASPVDGDEAYLLVDATAGVVWHLRYRAAGGTNKWEFLGGSPLFSEIQPATYEATTSATYAALATAGPSLAVPRAGEYVVELGARVAIATAGSGARMSYDIGATGAVDADGIRIRNPDGAGNGETHAARAMRKTLTALTLTAKYKSEGGTTTSFISRWMRVTPVRIS